jgi:hypothetical protein
MGAADCRHGEVGQVSLGGYVPVRYYLHEAQEGLDA